MLQIRFRKTEHTIYYVDDVFNLNFEEEWMKDSLVKEMVKDVDSSDVVSPYCIQSPVLGQIPPEKLSGGVKALILMLNEPDWEVWATACGNNCAKWIKKIAEIFDEKGQNLCISLTHFMNFGNNDFEVMDADTGEVDTYWNMIVKHGL